MSTYGLDRLFSPRSVAVVGASPRITSAGHAVLRNLRAGGFKGSLHLVNPRYPEIDGIRSVKSILDLADTPDLGFSAVASLGDTVEVDMGDLLDFFALDRSTRAILLYIESVTDARKFMSAARAAARTKPVVVVKSGRHAQGARAAQTHTGALAGADAVYDAAFRRAGLLRVLDLDDLFAAAEA